MWITVLRRRIFSLFSYYRVFTTRYHASCGFFFAGGLFVCLVLVFSHYYQNTNIPERGGYIFQSSISFPFGRDSLTSCLKQLLLEWHLYGDKYSLPMPNLTGFIIQADTDMSLAIVAIVPLLFFCVSWWDGDSRDLFMERFLFRVFKTSSFYNQNFIINRRI